MRRALGVKPGDTVRYQVEGGKLAVTVVRPDTERVLGNFLATYGLSGLHDEVGEDAVGYVRRLRG